MALHGPATAAATALEHAISSDRYASYLAAAAGNPHLARELYVWDRDLAGAIMADLAIVEVGLRNAMHHALTNEWGAFWYECADVELDDRSCNQLATAWNHLPRAVRNNPTGPDVPGRLVAQCTFGFWVNLLDAGDHAGRSPRRYRTDYEKLWRPALRKAFPGGRVEVANDPDPAARFVRSWTHGVAKRVNVLRNRVAHHEPLHNGFPLPGQHARRTPAQAHDDYLKLARMIDRDLAEWIRQDTDVPDLLNDRPV